MIRAFTFTAVALVTFSLPGISKASDACPCYTTAEIVASCPRPDADHTEAYDTGGNGKSRILKCFATQNYSPGSIRFETGLTEGNADAYCGRQSVGVQPYADGGEFPPVSLDVYAACKSILDDAAKKLKLSLVMDSFSKKEILTTSYSDYIKARGKAKSWSDLFPFLSSKSVKEIQAMSAEELQMIFEMSQFIAGSQKDNKVIVEAIDDNQSVVVAQFCSDNNKIGQHTVWYVVEDGSWKIRKEYNHVGSESCASAGDASQKPLSCTDEEADKADDKLNDLIDMAPKKDRDSLYSESTGHAMAELGSDFCTKDENFCACTEEAIKFLEAK